MQLLRLGSDDTTFVVDRHVLYAEEVTIEIGLSTLDSVLNASSAMHLNPRDAFGLDTAIAYSTTSRYPKFPMVGGRYRRIVLRIFVFLLAARAQRVKAHAPSGSVEKRSTAIHTVDFCRERGLLVDAALLAQSNGIKTQGSRPRRAISFRRTRIFCFYVLPYSARRSEA